ncbi:organic cation transporter protein isoform X1 [Apis mellifera caucasica]|uniref:Organic cation transporter protein isoform X1 n=2 Tax=Apis mellifera TaxID=7460 RepID=A0A7M7SRY8_APIME|nr:organic cation transporter protein isoform X1 [Apis mellifera]XP_006563155.1 organic cation transporter protein isoform X1 [Apis mellifera]XP_006563156.1 organic cation transporter protein isoform X1 [Apis mellifera]XP_026301549.1 organic cation transporter protein isoform X1 [Apis mellifera]KAG6796420.1 organic cation transporter protein isoform X1 [Apis mellifera caucasica]KAG9428103.1 organic cation transporter protein isoform X1 [Apis mellifera carnica]|eukprot:XP_006563154.1 organic cation transporter protein isoform X1 [Apis mellifera]
MKNTQTNIYVEVNGKQISNGKEEIVENENDEVDAVQQAIGNLGRWQIYVCLAISLVKFPIAWHQLAIVFMAPHQVYNCTSPTRTETADQCVTNVNGTLLDCTEWEYDRRTFTETIISQWNLVCSRTHYANIQQSILMFGVLLGNIIFGNLADRYGRKMPLMISVVLQLASGIGCAVVPWFPALLLMKLLSALATGGTMVTSYVICMEIVGTKWRAAITVLYQIPFSLGHMSLAGLAYYFRHWQHLQIAITLPSVILLSYWWIVPESPRWLLAFGKQRAACKILQKAANINNIKNKDIPNMVKQHCLHQNSKRSDFDYKASFLDLFRTPNMRIKSLSIFFNWIVCGMGLFGMSQYIGQVGGNIFVNFTVSGAIQIPGNFVAWWAMNKLGRRITLICSNSIAGISALLLIIVSNDIEWLRLILVCLGIVGMSVSFTTVYLFSGELFPTVVRNIGVGTSSMCARIGSITAPFVVSLDHIQTWLPPACFGILPLLGAALCFLLPETVGCTLPETLQDGENFGKTTRRKLYKISQENYSKNMEAEATL